MKMRFIAISTPDGDMVLSTKSIVAVQALDIDINEPKGFIVTTDGRKIEFYDNYEAVSTAVINSP